MLRLKKRRTSHDVAEEIEKKSRLEEDDEEEEVLSSDSDDIQLIGLKKSALPVWHDSDDSEEENEDQISRRVEKIIGPIPQHLLKRGSKHLDSESSESETETNVVVRAGPIHARPVSLPPDTLQTSRLRDANADDPARALVSSARFHPWSPVVMVGSTDRSLKLFHVDGEKNEKLADHYFDLFPIKCARFTPDGRRVVAAGIRKSFRVLDIDSGNVQTVHCMRGVDRPVHLLEVSPDGKYIVLVGVHGLLHVIETASMEKIASMEANGRVMSLVFPSEDTLFAFSDDGRVYRFSLRSRRLEGSFGDEGCVGGRAVAVSKDGDYVACGQSTGVVNLYHQSATQRNTDPTPFKTVDNLLTQCDSLRFSPSSEILMMASSHEHNAIKALHTATGRVFANFPGRTDKFAKVTDIDFSPSGGQMIIGQSNGRVALMRLLYYDQ